MFTWFISVSTHDLGDSTSMLIQLPTIGTVSSAQCLRAFPKSLYPKVGYLTLLVLTQKHLQKFKAVPLKFNVHTCHLVILIKCRF